MAKKAARTRRRRHSPAQSVPPRDEAEEEEDDELDVNVFERLRGVIPDSDAQELLVGVRRRASPQRLLPPGWNR